MFLLHSLGLYGFIGYTQKRVGLWDNCAYIILGPPATITYVCIPESVPICRPTVAVMKVYPNLNLWPRWVIPYTRQRAYIT